MSASSTIVMTGASSGFGRHAARRVLRDRPEAHLVILARGDRGTALADELRSESGSHEVTVLPGDLASLDSIRAAAGRLGQLLDDGALAPLKGIVGNGGLTSIDRTRTSADGFELTFAVNVLANVSLINQLAPRLTDPSRIVLTTSGSHAGDFVHNRLWGLADPRWDTVTALAEPGGGPEDPTSAKAGSRAYATSKLAVLYLVHDLARRLPAGSTAHAFNPDFVTGTGLVRDAGPGIRLGLRAITPLLRATGLGISPERAGQMLAATIVGAPPGPSGSYVVRSKLAQPSAASRDPKRERDLWDEASRLTSSSWEAPGAAPPRAPWSRAWPGRARR